jgi:hypothetical protein
VYAKAALWLDSSFEEVSGSHHLGHLTYTLSENDERNVLNQTVLGAETFEEPVNVELKAGEISIHSARSSTLGASALGKEES